MGADLGIPLPSDNGMEAGLSNGQTAMTIADWVCLAFDSAASPFTGSLAHEDGRHYVCLYKNWVEFGEQGGQVGTMERGRARIRGFDVIIDRVHEDAPVFLIASTLDACGRWRWIAGMGCRAGGDLSRAKTDFLNWLKHQADERMFAGKDQRNGVNCCIEHGGIFVGQGSDLPRIMA